MQKLYRFDTKFSLQTVCLSVLATLKESFWNDNVTCSQCETLIPEHILCLVALCVRNLIEQLYVEHTIDSLVNG